MVKAVNVRTILNKHKKRDEWFLDDYTLNPYIGCAYNCLYCYTKGSKYRGTYHSVFAVKINAPQLLEKELARYARKKKYGIIAISSATEPYPPIEAKIKLTQKLLRIILRYRFPVEIITKSTLVLRDTELLSKIDTNAILPSDLRYTLKRGVIISFSISTLDKNIAKMLELGAPPPIKRLETMKQLKELGFYVGVCFIPVLPFLSDTEEELERTISAVKKYGADFVFVGALTLYGNQPTDSKTLYYNFLKKHYPDLLEKYKMLYRDNSVPPKTYQNWLKLKASSLCKKYSIKNSLT